MVYRRFLPALPVVAVVGMLALAGVSCGDGGGSSVPSGPGTSSPPPTTLPPSDGGGGVGASSCHLGEGDPRASCDREFSELMPYVEAAMDQLVRDHPEYFDLSVEAGDETRQYRVLDKEAYLDGVVAELQSMGLCAGRSNTDYEIIQAKIENGYSEDFDLYTSDGFMRRGSGSYRSTCTPAAFPLARDPNAPPIGSGCGVPYPPPVSRFNIKVHLVGQEYDTIDSTPIVGHDAAYCAAIGYTDGRSLCPVRPEADPEREACEAWLVGTAQDTGRVGPTWTNTEGQYCTGPESGCANADNQYSLWVYKSGTYTACAQNMACGSIEVIR